ncbi:unnamed protein product [Ostreobium quekettii]|uniref:Uncharacterized protein n=1 Tax=Ostreobium quekettii TaxID=121088 RepID=A0A8S1INS5_9CHLO|nr:unnamed protein product [Ostreobium quekettii]
MGTKFESTNVVTGLQGNVGLQLLNAPRRKFSRQYGTHKGSRGVAVRHVRIPSIGVHRTMILTLQIKYLVRKQTRIKKAIEPKRRSPDFPGGLTTVCSGPMIRGDGVRLC